MGVKLWLLATLVLFFIKDAFAQNWSVALPGCQESCGSLVVPYPFGIGSNCSASKVFEIHCNNSFNPPKPFLRMSTLDAYTYLEVMDISVLDPDKGATARVKYPITRDCIDKSDEDPVIDLPSGFTFSDTENRFIAMGCDNLALLTSGLYPEEFTTAGCVSMCNTSSPKYDNSCFGINCCQSKFQYPLLNIRTSLNPSRSGQASARCNEGPRYVLPWLFSNFCFRHKPFLSLPLDAGMDSLLIRTGLKGWKISTVYEKWKQFLLC